ncbi:CDP-alcohol phosphatidyltransferase family protein [Aestuariibius sp. 2305UL40-4]|uniref:CDP-alcohol phosphatidyltransferase family protein n=1 Tax=Aestuariibius violaceus TaxID=3234132 RepID=UPI00345EFFDA
MILVSALFFGAEDSMESVGVALLAYLAATAFSTYAIHHSYPHAKLGLCNLATLARLVIAGVLLVALLERAMPSAGLLVLAILSLSLDGVDGWLARREGLSSSFGARFDVEVDAAFALLLAVYAARTGVAEAYVILLGLPHYLFWLAKHLCPWLDQPLPPRFGRKAVCVMQISALIALLVPQFDGMVMDAVILTVVAALVWSFGRDILWLYGRRS